MNKEKVILSAEKLVKNTLGDDSSGHDPWHVERVRKNALKIAKEEHADEFVVELSALLHDVWDYKVHKGDDEEILMRRFLEQEGVDEEIILHVMDIVTSLSFNTGKIMKTREGKCVQDADRLDALGAIGIARVFATGATFGQQMYNPDIPPKDFVNTKEYRENLLEGKSTSLNHFDEKILKLKNLMNTVKGRELAEEGHTFIENFKKQFLKEWNA